MIRNFIFIISIFSVITFFNSCARQPTATISANKIQFNVGEAVIFTNSTLHATSYEWDFGDGSAISTEKEPTHSWDYSGVYSVKMTAFSKKKKKKDEATITIPIKDTADIGSQTGKTFIFSVDWSPGDTYAPYLGIIPFFTPDDMVLVYCFWANYTNDFYVLLPITKNGVFSYAEVSEIDGLIFVNHENDSTGTSPFTSFVTYKYKAILIPSSQKTLHPDINFDNYEQVVKAYNL